METKLTISKESLKRFKADSGIINTHSQKALNEIRKPQKKEQLTLKDRTKPNPCKVWYKYKNNDYEREFTNILTACKWIEKRSKETNFKFIELRGATWTVVNRETIKEWAEA